MSDSTEQMKVWAGAFGKEYTDRNALSVEDMDALYQDRYGVTRTELNEEFLGDVSRSARLLEVGSNVGNQLLCLQSMGFQKLYGIELQDYAVQLSKSRTTAINILQGSAFDLPFRDGYFDVVFTSGVLIHISPSDIDRAMAEIYRCTRRYVWGLEYFADEYTEVQYRGQESLLWKADFLALYLERFPCLRLLRRRQLAYADSDNVDSMFLLEKVTE